MDKEKTNQEWQKHLAQEKAKAKENNQPYHEPTFTIFLSSLTMQAMIALGKIENPITNSTEKNFEQARFLIDTLGVIKEKTKNNLEKAENNFLEESLFNLRTLYIEEGNKK